MQTLLQKKGKIVSPISWPINQLTNQPSTPISSPPKPKLWSPINKKFFSKEETDDKEDEDDGDKLPPPALHNLSSSDSEQDTHGYEMPSNLQSPPPSVHILTIDISNDIEEA